MAIDEMKADIEKDISIGFMSWSVESGSRETSLSIGCSLFIRYAVHS